MGAGLVTAARADIDSVEMVGSVMVADRYGFKPDLVIGARFGGSPSVYDTSPAFALAAYSRRSPEEIWRYRSAGHGWDACATYAGVSRDTYNGLYSNHQFDTDYLWADEFSNRYELDRADLLAMRRAGYTWKQIAQAAIVSQDTQEPIGIILTRARTSRVYYPPHYAYRPTPIYVPPRFSNTIFLPARPSYASWWNRPTTGLSMYYSSSGGFGLSINFSRQRRPVYSCWSPQPIVRGYPYHPIVIARPPRNYRPPIIINKTVNKTTINIDIRNRRSKVLNTWNSARTRTVKEREVAVRTRPVTVPGRPGTSPTRPRGPKGTTIFPGGKPNPGGPNRPSLPPRKGPKTNPLTPGHPPIGQPRVKPVKQVKTKEPVKKQPVKKEVTKKVHPPKGGDKKKKNGQDN